MIAIEQLHEKFLASTGACTDSRKLFAGCMFFALKGDSFNGNAYAAAAIEQGATFAVVDEEVNAPAEKIIRVENVLKSLQELATFHRKYLGLPILAITGTNGKTTTKELITAALSQKYKTVATQGNLNNHIGVPLTLLGMSKSTQLGVVEMGANHPHEIAALCAIAQPNAGLITNVGKAHLEGFGSFEGVKKTKAELYDYLVKNGGQIFALSDSSDLQEMLHERGVQNTIFYGSASVENEAENSPFLALRINSELWQTKLVGGYNAPNVLAAAAVARYFGVEENKIRKAIENYAPQNNRSQLIKTAYNTIIMDAYNANPTSMAAAVSNFAKVQAEQKLLILGDMLELGKDAQTEHQKLVELLQQLSLKNACLVGKIFCEAAKKSVYLTFEDSNALCEYLKKEPHKNYTILVKGSRGIQLEKVKEFL
ncbi:MAG: UDP-N-acetylmuramoyl-tripeptide--D-alanyl-D-alanine ligase [Prevotellaceae bacterium]|jgi:UDP-N-acetylmuramoyl-tripeptide--D-alanyl-D-alanine ligase|nr:UDP-N-acetylmuramoyl-tripeptide--D-alanyl-D-alanine ligase [Prevotellaceae bacterium]